jgi:hypothetical protein
LTALPGGCSFAPRCPYAEDRCLLQVPGETWLSGSHMARCVLVEADGKAGSKPTVETLCRTAKS